MQYICNVDHQLAYSQKDLRVHKLVTGTIQKCNVKCLDKVVGWDA